MSRRVGSRFADPPATYRIGAAPCRVDASGAEFRPRAPAYVPGRMGLEAHPGWNPTSGGVTDERNPAIPPIRFRGHRAPGLTEGAGSCPPGGPQRPRYPHYPWGGNRPPASPSWNGPPGRGGWRGAVAPASPVHVVGEQRLVRQVGAVEGAHHRVEDGFPVAVVEAAVLLSGEGQYPFGHRVGKDLELPLGPLSLDLVGEPGLDQFDEVGGRGVPGRTGG